VDTSTQTIAGITQPVAAYFYDGQGDRLRQVDYSGPMPITTTYTNDIAGLTQVFLAPTQSVALALCAGILLDAERHFRHSCPERRNEQKFSQLFHQAANLSKLAAW